MDPVIHCSTWLGLGLGIGIGIGSGLGLEGGLQHRIARDLSQVDGGEPPHLLCDAVLLHQWLLGVVEHERVVRRERHVEAGGEELVERALGEGEEERVVRERRERKPDLSEVVQVLERG